MTMNHADFDRLERELDLKLPDVYRERLSGSPSFPGAIARQIAIPEIVDELLAVNRECRRSGHPKHRFALGFAENADIAYGLDCSVDPAPVLRMKMGSSEAEEEAPDFPAWIEQLARSALNVPTGMLADGKKAGWKLWKRR